MEAQILFKRLWTDVEDKTTTLEILTSDGHSTFSNQVYLSNKALDHIESEIRLFCDDYYNGIYDLSIGIFGKEYAYGAFLANFRFYEPGRLYISTTQETEFFKFAGDMVAKQAQMHLRSEPALLQNFSAEFTLLIKGTLDEAKLICL
nr:hypothetical protein [uncultured Undibacterium sp.]